MIKVGDRDQRDELDEMWINEMWINEMNYTEIGGASSTSALIRVSLIPALYAISTYKPIAVADKQKLLFELPQLFWVPPM